MRCIALLLASAGPLLAAIDLAPVASTRELEGIKFSQVLFRDGERKIAYEPPAGWSYGKDAAALFLHPPGKTLAEAMIDEVPRAPGASAEEQMKQMREAALSFVPKGAEEVKVADQPGPLQIDGRDTVELTAEYKFFGQRFQLSVLFFDLPNSCLRFRVQSLTPDFEDVRKAFQRSLCTWQWLPLKTSNQPTVRQ